eukprot:m.733551 g.733551  ORF g.733551 m.733551 type:complete len:70 (-) comp58877_c0_seq4:3078-3287(-)
MWQTSPTRPVLYSGTVSIADTAIDNSNLPCGLAGATACFINHYRSNENLICTETELNCPLSEVLDAIVF